MKNKIAILITTFLRDNLLCKTIQNIVDNKPKDCIVLIADQGYTDSEKDITIDYFKSQIPLEYYKIPFDSGLSYARNFLVQKANEIQIPYCLISADSIQFTQLYDFQSIIDFMKDHSEIGRVGFELENSKCSWEYLLEVTPNGIKLSYPTNIIEFKNIKFTYVDICRNIFLAKTQSLIDVPYDNELKLGEHEDHAIRYKEKYLTCWTDYLSFKRINNRNNQEYETYRKRQPEYLKIFKQKYNMNGWVIYPSKRGNNCI
jgi:hypothetical protein